MKEKGKEKEKGDFVKLEEAEMTESERTKYRLKNFFCIIGILLIFVAISIIILIIFNKDLPPQKPDKKINNWNDSYIKADEFISKLNLTERIGLLYGTENMKSIITPLLKNLRKQIRSIMYIFVSQWIL